MSLGQITLLVLMIAIFINAIIYWKVKGSPYDKSPFTNIWQTITGFSFGIGIVVLCVGTIIFIVSNW
jgi:hypothetical protein